VEANPYESLALRDEPSWPDGHEAILFLLEISGPLEEKLLEGWIARKRRGNDDGASVHRAHLPQTRRRRRRRRADPRLEAFLSGGDDPLVVPLRVIWLPRSRDGKRVVGWRDLLEFGDPRDPDPIRQHVIFRLRPGRCRIVMGEPLRAADLRQAWSDPEGTGVREGLSLADFAAARAWLALERAERSLRGNRYKVPKFPRESLVDTRTFARGVARLATDAGVRYELMSVRTRRYVREIAATHSPYVIDLVAGGFRWIIGKAYVDLRYDRDELAALYQMSQQYPLVFLPSHKSNFDHLVLLYVLYQNGLPPNHTAGGINMNFFPVGPFLRRSGVFFIRREFGSNEPYKFVLRRYLDYLLEKRFPLEWFIEGTRSRSGKMGPPRLGLLAYVVESFERGTTDDVVFVPVSIAYDQIQDVGSYTIEQRGGKKERESFGWFLNTLRSLRRRYGAAHIRFGAPISLGSFLAAQEAPPVEADDDRNPAIPKLAFEVSARINEVTPITPISLVTLALLSAGDRALTLDEIVEALEPFASYVAERGLPVTEKLAADDRRRIVGALSDLEDNDVVTRFEGTTDTVYRIGREQHLAAAYYRNTIIHFFINGAIVELALLRLKGGEEKAVPGDLLDDALILRDILKFEFFFAGSDEFTDQIRAELAYHDPKWKDRIAAGEVDLLLDTFHPFRSPAILRPFFEAYQLVGDVVERRAYESTLNPDELADEALALGKQYLLQGRLHSPESVSSLLVESALKLAENRGLFRVGADMVDKRLGFAADLRQVVRRLEVLDTLEAARAAGAID
jgi:glycerol-3-phosphate O-acyltransferase